MLDKQEAIEGYKVFNDDWTCRDKQYEVGKVYHEDGVIAICKHGMHFCRDLSDCFNYYPFNPKNHVAKVRGWGTVQEESYLDSKICVSDLETVSEVKDWYTNEDLRIDVVKQYGACIQYIDNPSEKVQLEAVKNRGVSIRHIDNPREKVQVAAVKECWVSIRYIDNPSERVQLLAVNQDTEALGYIDNPTDKVQLEAVSWDPHAIQYIKNPSEALQLVAVNKDAFAIDYILHPTEKVCKLAHAKGF